MHYRTIWISDIHLGTRGCQAEKLHAFLKENTADTLFLVGDIIDGWALSRKIYFPPSHVKVVKKFLSLANKRRVILISGNHDEALDHLIPFSIGNIEIKKECEHITPDGQRFLVCHGDEYDQVTKHARWVAVLGDIAYEFLMKSNGWINWIRRRLGFGYWSLSAYAKTKVKGVVSFIGDFENAVTRDAALRGYDGVVCGHIHFCEMKSINGVLYINSGDWVESCTAIAETYEGELAILEYGDT